MRVQVRLFGGLTDRVGRSRTEVEVDDDATVADLRDAVARAHPELAPLLHRVNVAVDLEVADDDDRLVGASEFALLPPVAGGAAARDVEAAGGRLLVLTGLRRPPLAVEEAIAAVTTPEVGGVAVFLGTVRDHSSTTARVVRLDYSAYEEMAERVLGQLADELAADHPQLRGVALLHSVGDLTVGSHTVLIVCAAPHRDQAFDACRDALERVKDRVPVFKRELDPDGGSHWIGLPDGHRHEPPTQ